MPFPLISGRTLNNAIRRVALDATTRDQLLALIVEAVFPPRCGGCFRLGKEVFCYRCQLNIHPIVNPYCSHCGVPFDPIAKNNNICSKCRLTPPKYDAARSHQRFEGPIREAIHRLKYHRQFDYARRLTPLLLEVLQSDEKFQQFEPHFLVPVPLHKSRIKARGFNQSAVLSNQLSKLTEVPVYEALIRNRKTQPQVGLNVGERLKNVKGAFEFSTTSTNQVIGKRILLIDDVFTTGATLNECAMVLKKAGAIEVFALTLARQRSPQDNQPIYEKWSENVV
jgi:ComF family protein